MRYQLGFSLLLLGASALHAAQFNFSYSGSGVTATGTITATNMRGGVYQVTNISGTRDGTQAITGLVPGGLAFLYNGPGGAIGLEGAGVVEFDIKGVTGYDSFEYIGGRGPGRGGAGGPWYEEIMFNSRGVPTSTASLTSFKITAVPEPSTPLIFLTLGTLVWALGRKLPIRTVRKP
jgi:hypothetical protein